MALVAMLSGIAAGWVAPVSPARAQQAGEAAPVNFSVPAGALEDALNSFARQAGITLSFDPALVHGKQAAALAGRHTVPSALAALLAAHGLEAVPGASGAYAVRPAAPPATGTAALPALTVTAEAERADGQTTGYVAQRSGSATRSDMALIETPRSVTVVTREQMDDQAVHTVEQSLRYSAGVQTEASGYDPRFSSLLVRGFVPAEYLDGFKLPTGSAIARWPAEPQGLERVELLKGPSAIYDPSAPGGAINMVSKRPSAEAVREVSVSVGNNDRYQGSFDIGGAWNADGTLLWRLNGVARKSGGQTDFSRDDRAFIAPSLTWRPSARTQVTLLAESTRDLMTPKSVWPVGALLAPNPNGTIPRDRFTGEPGFDRYNRSATSLAYLLEHQIDEHWTLRQNARYATLDVDYRQLVGDSFQADQRTLDRTATWLRERNRSLTLDTQLETRFRTGPVAHTLLMGLELQRQSNQSQFSVGPAPSLDVFAPVYGAPVPESPFGIQASNSIAQRGVHLQDQMRAGPWSLNLAVRQDRVRTTTAALPGTATRQLPDTRTTYNAGLLYLAPNGLAPYMSYATSFTPTVGFLGSGDLPKPELGRQFEVGLKYRPPGMDALFTVSVFDLKKNNVSVPSQNLFAAIAQIGETRTRGPEFEARAALTRQLKLVASYTLLDATLGRGLTVLDLTSGQPANTARQTAALWLDYRFANPELQGWSIGGGVRRVGKVPIGPDGSAFNPPYTLADAAIRYEHGPYAFAVNATNLFDRRYVAGYGQFFGQGRTLQAKATVRW